MALSNQQERQIETLAARRSRQPSDAQPAPAEPARRSHLRDLRDRAEALVERLLPVRVHMSSDGAFVKYCLAEGRKTGVDDRALLLAVDFVVADRIPRWPLAQSTFASKPAALPKAKPVLPSRETLKLMKEVARFAARQAKIHGNVKASAFAEEYACLRGLPKHRASWVIADAIQGRLFEGYGNG